MRTLTYRINYTLRLNGLEHETCHYCETLEGVNAFLLKLEGWGAWGIEIHEAPQ
jgi:hypothetical protein